MGRSQVVFICRQHASLYRQVLVAQMVKNLPANARKPGVNPWVGKIPWRREWQPMGTEAGVTQSPHWGNSLSQRRNI